MLLGYLGRSLPSHPHPVVLIPPYISSIIFGPESNSLLHPSCEMLCKSCGEQGKQPVRLPAKFRFINGIRGGAAGTHCLVDARVIDFNGKRSRSNKDVFRAGRMPGAGMSG